MHLKDATIKALRNVVAAARRVVDHRRIKPILDWLVAQRTWAYGIAIAGAAFLLVYPTTLRDRWDDFVLSWFPPENEGLILLETPQVFTRQRLVNDRAVEQAWLEEQLNRSAELMKAGAFAKAEFISFARRHLAMALQPRDASTQSSSLFAEKKPEPEIDEIRKRVAAIGLNPPPLDQFEDARLYREAVRNAIMTTVLDDRHDIEGNTVYRLNFNVTVVPPARSRRVAVAVVALGESAPPGNELKDYVDLMFDWREKLQEQSARIVDDRIQTIINGAELEPEENGELRDWLLKSSRGALSALLSVHGEKAADSLLARIHERIAANVRAQQIAMMRQAFHHNKYLEKELADKQPDVQLQMLGGAVMQCQQTNALQLGSYVPPPVYESIPESERVTSCARLPSMSALRASVAILDLLESIREAKGYGIRVVERKHEMCMSDSPGFVEMVANAVAPAPTEAPLPPKSTLPGKPPTAGSSSTPPSGQASVKPPPDPPCVAAGKTIFNQRAVAVAPRSRPYADVIGAFALDYMLRKPAKTPSRPFDQGFSLSKFFELRTPETCIRATCLPYIDFKSDTSRKETALDKARRGAHALRQILSERAVPFTYSVTPNKSVIRSEIARHESAEIGATQAVGGRQGAAASSTSMGIAGLARDPTIMGFGQWMGDGTLPGITRFGWAMFPRPRPEPSWRKSQAPESYSVSALVSLPGWWKSVHLAVRTCWVSEAEVQKTAHLETICPPEPTPDERPGAPRRPTYHLDIRLPGQAQEISNNLRFDVIRHPYLDRMDGQPEAEVGREAQLVIRGVRLWRSPVVTFGNQKADRIEVLPDMNGIVAHFKCVLPEPGSAGLDLEQLLHDRQKAEERARTAGQPSRPGDVPAKKGAENNKESGSAEKRESTATPPVQGDSKAKPDANAGTASAGKNKPSYMGASVPPKYARAPDARLYERSLQVVTSEGMTPPIRVRLRPFTPRVMPNQSEGWQGLGEAKKEVIEAVDLPCWVEAKLEKERLANQGK